MMGNGLTWSFPVGRFFGVSVRADVTLLLVPLIYKGYADSWTGALLAFVVVFASVFLHEMGHVFATKAVGGRSDLVVLWLFGGLAFTDVPHRPGANLIVTICGPLVNVVLFMAGYAVLLSGLVRPGTTEAELVQFLINVNQVLALFNLLPAFPMDGGRIVQAMLWPFLGYLRSLKATCVLGIVVSVGAAVYMFLRESTFGMILMIWVGVYAFQTLQAVRRLPPDR